MKVDAGMKEEKEEGSVSTTPDVPSNFSAAVAPVVYTIHRLGRKKHAPANKQQEK